VDIRLQAWDVIVQNVAINLQHTVGEAWDKSLLPLTVPLQPGGKSAVHMAHGTASGERHLS
jgi:hypothetical protein